MPERTIQEQVVREAPEIEAIKLGLLEDAKTLAGIPIDVPEQLVAGFTPEQREYYYRNTNMRHVPKAIFKILSKEAQKRIMLSIRARAKHSLQWITSRDMRELTAEWAQERPEGQSQWDVAVWGMTKKMGFDQMTAEMVASGLYTQKRKE